MAAVSPFIGAIMIVFGLLITYAGARFLFAVLSFIIALLVTSVSFLLIFNLFISITAPAIQVYGVLVLCILIGVIVTSVTYEVTGKATIPIIAGICGVFAMLAIYNSTILSTSLDSPLVKILFCLCGFALGAHFGHKAQFSFKTIGTAFIGAHIIIHGISFYYGHFELPNLSEDITEVSASQLGICAGWFALFVSGTWVQ